MDKVRRFTRDDRLLCNGLVLVCGVNRMLDWKPGANVLVLCFSVIVCAKRGHNGICAVKNESRAWKCMVEMNTRAINENEIRQNKIVHRK